MYNNDTLYTVIFDELVERNRIIFVDDSCIMIGRLRTSTEGEEKKISSFSLSF